MKLQILINHYQESPELIGRLLQSIAEQTVKNDFEVIIASDGGEYALDKDFLDGFPFAIQYYVLPRKGTRATRNALLDMSDADYLMFCDADDCFKSADGLSKLFDAAKDNPDIVSVPFEAEVKDGDGYKYVKIPTNAIWIHGKIFRRQYLIENNIRFDEIANHGEMSFLWLAFHLTKNIRFLSTIFYIWKCNENSVTRSNPFFNVRTYDKMLNSYSRLIEEVTERGRRDLRDELIAGITFTAYIDSAGNWNDAPSEYVESARKAVAAFIRRFRSDYENLDEKFRWRKYNAILVAKRTRGPSGGFAAITAWMDKIGAENE